MTYLVVLIAVTLVSAVLFRYISRESRIYKNLPGGSLGFPIIGETLSFYKAQSENRGMEWLNQRISKHGPVFKTSLIGSPTIVMAGQAGNKFVLCADDDVLATKQPLTVQKIIGKHSILELTGPRYKLVKKAMVSFLNSGSLQNYVGHMDNLVKTLILAETKGKEIIKVVPLIKMITFNVACDILFRIDDEHVKAALLDDFTMVVKVMVSFPLNLPGTVFKRGMQARKRMVDRLLPIIEERKEQLCKGVSTPTSDILSSLLALRDENQQPLAGDEVIDNLISLIFANYDITSVLSCLMIWKITKDPQIYHNILQEQLDILSEREGSVERLTWEEIQKMKYTWRVAQELMRITPPAFGSFRKVVKDTSFGGYDIPQGWQVFWVAGVTHMDGDLFENPENFDPCRFDKNVSKPIAPYTYIPYGGGLHGCIGNEFSRVEILITIHNLVTSYEWTQICPEEIITGQPMPFPSMGLPIKINPRNAS